MRRISNEELNRILDIVYADDVCMDVFEGSLTGNYIIYNDNYIGVDGKRTKYIILKEEYVNEWTSGTDMICTDDYEVVDQYIKLWEENDE